MLNKSEVKEILDRYYGEGVPQKEITREELLEIFTTLKDATDESDLNHVLIENLLKHLPESVYFKDRESQFIRVNDYQAKLHGFEHPEDMVGKTDFDLFPFKTAIQKFADEQKVMEENAAVMEKDELDISEEGEERWVSSIKLPLISKDGEVIGTFGISRDITDRKLAELELEKALSELTEKNSQIESDLKMAHNVQMAFIPKSYPSFIWDLSSNESALQFYHRYVPSETLAGDFFQVVPISNSQAGVIICDVMGHGVRASLVTAILRGLVGEMKMVTPYPHVFLRKINRSLNQVFRQLDAMMFVTAFYGVIDLIKGQFRYANAGHPSPIWIQRSKGVCEPLPAVSDNPEPALGLVNRFRYSSRTLEISPRDGFVFFTDGISEVENENGDQFGDDRICESLNNVDSENTDQLLDNLMAEVDTFTGGEGGLDDMCAVGLDIIRIADKSA